MGRFVVFDSEREVKLSDLRRRRELALPIIAEHDDPLSLAAVETYFARLLTTSDVDALKIMPLLAKPLPRKLEEARWPFRDIGETFRLIDEDTVPVIVPWGDAAALVQELKGCQIGQRAAPLKLLRALQQVSVSVYRGAFTRLQEAGAISMVGPDRRFAALERASLYHEHVGLLSAVDRRPEENIL